LGFKRAAIKSPLETGETMALSITERYLIERMKDGNGYIQLDASDGPRRSRAAQKLLQKEIFKVKFNPITKISTYRWGQNKSGAEE
jgi:hypothetical protein